MPINNHHTIEELRGIRCSVIERMISPERADFISAILKQNGLQVVSVTDNDGKVTIGVSDITFNLVQALYGRLLAISDARVVSPAYWYNQKDNEGFYWDFEYIK
jgi:hypothetical protein